MAVSDPLLEEPAHTVPAALAELPVLGLLPPDVRTLVLELFVPQCFAFGDVVVREGDHADSFWVLTEGLARAVITGSGGQEISLGTLRPGDAFGERALFEDSKRTATVRASSAVTAYRLDRDVFLAVSRAHPEVRARLALQTRSQRLANLLRVHPMCSRLPHAALGTLLDRVETVTIEPGEVATREGDAADAMFIVEEGRLRVSSRAGGEERDVGFLRSGDVFGEMALLQERPRAATVTALVPTTLLRLAAEDFHLLVADHRPFAEAVADAVAAYDARRRARVPLDFAGDLPVEEAAEPSASAAVGGEPDTADAEELAGAEAIPPRRPRGPRRFPHVHQIDMMDCGAACLAMVARHFGRAVSLPFIRQVAGTSTQGTSLRGIQHGGARIGLEIRAVKASKSSLDALDLPGIVHWEGNHWVVLHQVGPRHVRVADPATGLRRLRRDEFVEGWSGFAALPQPTPALAEAPVSAASARWLVPFLRPYRAALVVAFLLAVVAAGLQMLVPLLTARVIDEVLPTRDLARLNLLVGAMVAVLALGVAAALVQRRLLARAALGIDGSTMDYVTGILLRLPLSYFESRRASDIERRLSGLRQLRRLLVQEGVRGLTALTQLAVAVAFMLLLSWRLTIVFLLAMPAYAVLMRMSARRLRPTFDALEEAMSRYHARQIDALKGIDTVKSMAAEVSLRRLLLREFRALGERVFRSDTTVMLYDGAVTFTGMVTVALFLYFGALQVIGGRLSVGELVAFNSLVLLANAPILTLLQLWEQGQHAAVLLARLHDVFDHEPEQGEDHSHLRAVPTLGGSIRLRDVGFRYDTAPDTPILTDVSLDIPAGATVALVGRSGSGKTTLVKLLAGLIEPTSGTISFDGVDMAALSHAQLRRHIGVVMQAPYLFDDTIAANIAFGAEEPQLAAVQRAAEIADAHEFVTGLPLGYRTRVGESGLRLSGGQAQRIAIARALYHQPPVLLFDEATSALDTESERAVKQNMDTVFRDRTAVVVAHRLSTIRNADLICVLERGRIVEQGTHEELIARQGLYFHLHGQQLP